MGIMKIKDKFFFKFSSTKIKWSLTVKEIFFLSVLSRRKIGTVLPLSLLINHRVFIVIFQSQPTTWAKGTSTKSN